ncbi:MAG: polysaccharide deacetylase family protein [Bacteroidales bacterium]|nr:polysaccharide deacetylase family protein [Bacteroidales bacterium]
MFIERPPRLYRLFFPGAIWKIPQEQKCVYLTFDDGPIPEVTPWVLDLLDQYQVKATFFCVGDNVRKYPEIYEEILRRGHKTGNHTFNHIQGLKTLTHNYIANIQKATQYIDSKLFRPPHGHIRIPQFWFLRHRFRIVMWDLVTRDYSKKLNGDDVFCIVKKYVRNGSVIVFHDSLKSEKNMKQALPQAIEWLRSEGYVFNTIPSETESF